MGIVIAYRLNSGVMQSDLSASRINQSGQGQQVREVLHAFVSISISFCR
jgi:hypothetical protein